jgi:hypothetical protein
MIFHKVPQLHMQAVPPEILCMTAGLQARSQFASTGRSCGRPNESRISVIFLAPTANVQLASKLHFVLRVSEAAVKTLDFPSKLSPHSALKFRCIFLLHSPNSAKNSQTLCAA